MAGWMSLALVAFGDVINSNLSLLNLPFASVASWSALYGVTGLALWMATLETTSQEHRRGYWVVFALASTAALQIFTAGGNLGGLLLMSAGIGGSVLSAKELNWSIAVQSALFFLALTHDLQFAGALFLTGVFVIFQGFTALLVRVSQQEYQVRRALVSSNTQLRFTQALLSETVRAAERQRISRELHDGLGYHLTLVNMELEFARAVPDHTQQLEAVQRAQVLNRKAIGLVRENIEDTKFGCWEDIQRVKAAVMKAAPQLSMELELPHPLPELPDSIVHLCLRFLQESVTNTIKYAGASSFTFRLTAQTDLIVLSAEDDGCVQNLVKAQRGFSSLRNRIEAHGGTLNVTLAVQQAVRLEAHVPVVLAQP